MNVWAATSPCSPRCLSPAQPQVPALTAAARLGATAKAFVASTEFRARRVLDALDVRLVTDSSRLSVPGATGTLIVANHMSWLDIVALMAVDPVGFVAKREIALWPFVGRVAANAGTVFIARWALRKLPDAVAAIADRLRSGHSVAVFPEATTWCSAPGGPFRRAVFQAAIDADAPIRPVSLSYTQSGNPSTIATFVGQDTLARSVRRVAAARDLTLRLRAKPVLAPHGSRRDLAETARRSVAGTKPAHA